MHFFFFFSVLILVSSKVASFHKEAHRKYTLDIEDQLQEQILLNYSESNSVGSIHLNSIVEKKLDAA